VTTTRDASRAASSAEVIDGCAEWLARRQLALPALLFLTAHAPLRFLAGHALATAAPVAGLLGFTIVQNLADVLSDADTFAELEQAVHTADQVQAS